MKIYQTNVFRSDRPTGDDGPGMCLVNSHHSIIENKLKAIGLDGNAIAWFDAYLTNRMQVTKVGGFFSDPGVLVWGLPQGSTLSLQTNILC